MMVMRSKVMIAPEQGMRVKTITSHPQVVDDRRLFRHSRGWLLDMNAIT